MTLPDPPRHGSSAAAANHIPSLDGIRAISVALVFIAHSGAAEAVPGGFGVTVFFFLSGFLITTLLVREHDRHGNVSLGAFYLRRVVRLGPPIALTLAAATALVLAGAADGDLAPAAYLSQLFFVYNYYSLSPGAESSVDGLGVLWSLSVEEHFYLIWPVMFLAIVRGRLSSVAVFAALGGILLWRMIRAGVFGHDDWTIYISTDTRFDSLLYGCLLALMISAGQAEKVFRPSVPARAVWITAALGTLAASFLIRDELFRSTLRYTLQGLALMPIFHYAVAFPRDPLFRPLNWAPVRWIGLLSYTIYLCHHVIILALERDGVAAHGSPLLTVLAGSLSVGFAAVVYHFAERPLKPLRARLTGH